MFILGILHLQIEKGELERPSFPTNFKGRISHQGTHKSMNSGSLTASETNLRLHVLSPRIVYLNRIYIFLFYQKQKCFAQSIVALLWKFSYFCKSVSFHYITRITNKNYRVILFWFPGQQISEKSLAALNYFYFVPDYWKPESFPDKYNFFFTFCKHLFPGENILPALSSIIFNSCTMNFWI